MSAATQGRGGATPRPPQRAHGPMGPGIGAPVEKPSNFGASAARLARLLGPERWLVIAVIVLGAGSVALSVVGPKILGNATTVIFEGFISGTGIDFDSLHRILWWVVVIYVASAILGLVQGLVLNGVTQRTVYRLRARVEEKIHRLPLSYFDRHQRGDLLSRVTNDIDNISQTLQQTLSQLFTSVLTVIGIVGMMLWISPLLAGIAIVSIPLTLVIVAQVAKRSQPRFVAQWRHTGELNSIIEEGYTGHALVKVFGRRRRAQEEFARKNEELYEASFGAQFISGIIMPSTMFVGNLVYVAIAVVGGLRVASGAMTLGDVQAFIQYSRQFQQPLSQLGSMANLLQSGVASAERVFELLDSEEQGADPVPARSPEGDHGRLVFEDVSFRYVADKPLIDDLSHGRARAHGRDRGADRCGQDHPGQPHPALLRARRGTHHAGRHGHRGDDPRRPPLAHRHGVAGHVVVRRDHSRQHRVRAHWRDGGGDPRGGEGRVR